jgi:hypothetical protein
MDFIAPVIQGEYLGKSKSRSKNVYTFDGCKNTKISSRIWGKIIACFYQKGISGNLFKNKNIPAIIHPFLRIKYLKSFETPHFTIKYCSQKTQPNHSGAYVWHLAGWIGFGFMPHFRLRSRHQSRPPGF